MESILNFLADNYLYFMIGSVVLLFALIGFAVDGKKKKKDDVNPMNQMPNNMPTQNVQGTPEVQNPAPLSTGFSGFVDNSNQVPQPEVPIQTPAQEMPAQEVPTFDNLNVVPQAPEETLTFGPIENNEESIFTAPPVVDNNTNGVVNNQMPVNNEPVMESLDLATPQTVPSEMPVSMEREQPVMQAPMGNASMEQAPMQPQNVVEPPMFNNTIQQ